MSASTASGSNPSSSTAHSVTNESQSEENKDERTSQSSAESQNEKESGGNIPPLPEDYDEDLKEGDDPEKQRIQTPSVVYRCSWNARSPRRQLEPLTLPVSEVLITFTGSEECNTNIECLDLVHLLQRRDMYDKGLADIQYNFLVGGDATVYEGRGLQYHADKDPEHMDLKGKSIDIAYIGDFRDSVPLKKVIRACAGIVQMLVENSHVTEEFNLTPLGRSQPIWDKGDGCKGEECFTEGYQEVNWEKYPGFKSLDELLSKSLF